MLPTMNPTSSAATIATGTDHPASTSPHDTITALAEIVPAIDRSNTPAASGTSSPTRDDDQDRVLVEHRAMGQPGEPGVGHPQREHDPDQRVEVDDADVARAGTSST